MRFKIILWREYELFAMYLTEVCMNGYEKIVEQMRSQGAKNNPPGFELGVYQGNGLIKKANITLKRSDYYSLSFIQFEEDKNIYTHVSAVQESGIYEYEKNKIRAGDKVLMSKLLNSDKYLLFGKVT